MRNITQARAEWLSSRREEIARLVDVGHGECRGSCKNGYYCKNQGSGGWGWWVRACKIAGVKADARQYWSGSNPTPSTSIRRVLADYISLNAPAELL